MSESTIPNFEVLMIRTNLEDFPQAAPPSEFQIRTYRESDALEWVRIHELADQYNKVTLETFQHEFGYDIEAMSDRGFFIETQAGEVIGTATAWYDEDFEGEPYGRVHWVAIIPEYQGRGLAKPLLSAVMKRLAQSHDKAYLVTSSARIPAIQLYLKYGFQPFLHNVESLKAWDLVSTQLDHPLLRKPYLSSQRLLEISSAS
jgi:ribosomal protein S18 acetylase RimI-like enzyme